MHQRARTVRAGGGGMPRAREAPESRHWRTERCGVGLLPVCNFGHGVHRDLPSIQWLSVLMPTKVSTVIGDESVEELRRELAEAREQQVATAEILRVISSTPTDLPHVFAQIAASAASLCDAYDAVIFQADGDLLRLVAHHGPISTPSSFSLTRGVSLGRAVLDRQPIHIANLQAETDEYPEGSGRAQRLGVRTVLNVPLIRLGKSIGVIGIRRTEVRQFTDREIELLKTFADQAVIAIENTRLFEAEQARTRELTESLEYQTAISEVLSVISHSPDQLQPVLDVITETSVRLCRATHGHVRLLREDGAYHIAAHQIPDAELLKLMQENPFRPGMDSVAGRVALQGVTVHVADVGTDPFVSGFQRRISHKVKTAMGVPLKQGGRVVGIISVWHTHVQPFTERHIKLVETFADQAVIAINNVGLFEEVQARTMQLQESLRQQAGTADVLKTISRSAFDLQRVLDTLTEAAARLCGADKGLIRRREGGNYVLASTYGFSDEFKQWIASTVLATGRGSIVGRVALERKTVHIADVFNEPDWESGDWQRLGDFRSMIGTPLLRDGDMLGILVLHRTQAAPFTEKQIELVETFADQAVIAIENTRMFNEIVQQSQELEIASQHKSQFVANMSHELRTPLAAILGYAELMQEGFYEPQGPQSLAALSRIRSNGKHLLGLINTVLDIAKIESGQFKLNLGEYALENVVETVRSATESLAENKKLVLQTEITKGLPLGLGDEQRLTQVLLNLVGNAIKFTDAGEVRITARTADGHFAITVADTGPGIPHETPGTHLRTVPPGRQLQHQGQGRHWVGAGHRQTDRGNARRPHLGKVDTGPGCHLPA
jgi:GAF domain-containing protein